jgi:lipopolysaccharide biosynthesis glycosyltransferase
MANMQSDQRKQGFEVSAERAFNKHIAQLLPTQVVAYCFGPEGRSAFDVSYASLRKNTRRNIKVYCFTRQLGLLTDNYPCSSDIIQIDITDKTVSAFVDTYRTPDGITRSTFDRLFLPDLLPKNVKTCLYLDIDTLVLQDLEPLFNTIIRSPTGLCYRPSTGAWNSMKAACAGFNCSSVPAAMGDEDWIHGNVGVLLMDLEVLRNARFTARCEELLGIHHTNDQLIINYVCRGHFMPLPAFYNIYANKECIADFPAPGILHFAGPLKPWKELPQCGQCKAAWTEIAGQVDRTWKIEDRGSPNILAARSPKLT